MAKTPEGIHLQPAPNLAIGSVRFRLRAWHVLSGLILFSLLCWAGLFFLLGLAAAALRSINA